jgi:hypothetical protein
VSCGCGGLPPSVMLRKIALEQAVSIGVSGESAKVLAQEFYDFLRGSLDEASLNATAKRRASDSENHARNAFLQQSPSVLACAKAIGLKLSYHGINQIGTLVQWQAHQLRDHAGFDDPSEIQVLIDELKTHGLRLGMAADEIRNWILHGAAKDQHEAGA